MVASATYERTYYGRAKVKFAPTHSSAAFYVCCF